MMGAGSFTAFFRALAEVAKVVPLFLLNRLENELDEIDDTSLALSVNPSAHDLLRLRQLAERKERKLERVRAIRSALGNSD